MSNVSDLLSNTSYGLVREIRPSQLQMAADVEQVITDGGVYFVEGPTGVGKSFSYLTPLLLATGRRAVIATAKKGLQDQIKNKDLPALVNCLQQTFKSEFIEALIQTDDESGSKKNLIPGTVLKGKANYVCQLIAKTHSPPDSFYDWLSKNKGGEWGEWTFGRFPAWQPFATAENCIGRACAHWGTCAYPRLKQEAAVSKIVVVNHHLLGSDMFYGKGKLVGGNYDVLVIDEAHKFVDGLRAAFTLRATEKSAEEMVKALAVPNSPWVFPAAKALLDPWRSMFETISPDIQDHKGRRVDPKFRHLRETPVFENGHNDVIAGLSRLDNELRFTLKKYGVTPDGGMENVHTESDDLRLHLFQLATQQREVERLRRSVEIMQGVVETDDADSAAMESRRLRILGNTALTAEHTQHGWNLQAAPVNLGGIAKSYLSQVRTVILTSATLAVNGGFDHLDDVVGIKPTKTAILPPTFNYDKMGFSYIAPDLPVIWDKAPGAEEITLKRLGRCATLVRLSQGGAFILATSYADVDAYADYLSNSTKLPIFAQLTSSRKWKWKQANYEQPDNVSPWFGEPAAVLRRYLATPNAVLVATKSFWEGVDVPGEQLRLVIITKLPFPNPSDPMVIARKRAFIRWALETGMTAKEADQYAWDKVDLVDMLIDLRQGAGRLIRAHSDRGLVALLDTRAHWEPDGVRFKAKRYAAAARKALGFPKYTDQLSECEITLPKIVEYFKYLNKPEKNN